MVVDELVTILGLQADPKAKANAGKFEKMLGGIASVAKQAGAAVIGISGAAIAINSATTEFDNMAKAVGITTDELKAWEGVLAGTGFTAEHVTDIIDEMQLKIGESTGLADQITPVKEAMQILGLEFSKVSKLSPEDQFLAIASAAKEMGDSSEAAAAADILMGGESSRIIKLLRTQEGSLTDLLNAQREYNFLTEDGIKGARESSKEFNILRRVTTSLGQDIAGKAGAGIAVATAALTDFIVANNELISSGIGQVIDGISLGFNMFGDAVSLVADTVMQFIPELGFLTENLDAVQFIGIAVAGVLGALTVAAAAAAAPFVLMAAKITLAIAVIEDLYSWLSGGDSVIGDFVDAFAERFPNIAGVIGSVTDTIKNSFKAAFDFVLAMIDPVMNALNEIGGFLGDVIIGGLDKINDWFGSDDTQAAPLSVQSMNNATSNTSNNTTVNQTINGTNANEIANRAVGYMGLSSTANTGTYSYNRQGG